MSDMSWVWLGIAVFLFILEASTVNMVCIWFALGAIAAMVSALCGADLVWQIAIFVVASTAFLFLTRKYFKKFLVRGEEKTNVDSLIGRQALVCEDIDNLSEQGAAKIEGKVWTARSASDTPIVTGTKVTVLEIRGVKLIVEAE